MHGTDEGLTELALLLGAAPPLVRAAIGEPWSRGGEGSDRGGEITVFTGRENPRTPGRPLVAIRIDHLDDTVEVGHAVGVPLPNGRTQWALGEPRTIVPLDEEELSELARADGWPAVDDADARAYLLARLGEGIARVADVATLRGVQW